MERLTTDQLYDILSEGLNVSIDDYTLTKREEYYNGDQDILDNTDERSDGKDKNNLVGNFVGPLIDQLVGYALANGITLSSTLGDTAGETETKQREVLDKTREGLAEYERIAELNNIVAVDMEHYKQSLYKSAGVEVISLNENSEIKIKRYNLENWAFLLDQEGAVRVAIYKNTLLANSYHDRTDTVLEEDLTQWYVYYPTETVIYESENSDITTAEEVLVVSNNIGVLPVVDFRLQENLYDTFISKPLYLLQDAYNAILSGNQDTAEYDFDSILAFIGFDEPGVLFETNDDGKTVHETIKENRVVALKSGGDIKAAKRSSSFDSVEGHVKELRKNLFMTAACADLENIIGATGTASGIALTLALFRQVSKTKQLIPYFSASVRRRIDIINEINARLNRPIIQNYRVTIDPLEFVNETEIWSAQALLSDILSRESRLALIPSIKSPGVEVQKKDLEDKQAVDQAFHNLQHAESPLISNPGDIDGEENLSAP